MREEFLRALEAVAPGLAEKEILDQATCFVFQGGRVYTLNDEVAASHPIAQVVSGAVPARKLLDLMRGLSEAELDITETDKEIVIKGKGRRAGVRKEATVLLPLHSVDVPDEAAWRPLNPEFTEAVELACQCTLKPGQEPVQLGQVHITPTHVEACDNYQAIRYPLDTGVAGPVLLGRATAEALVGSGMTEHQEGANWLHYRNPAGLYLSLRKYVEEWPDIGGWMAKEGTPATLPMGLIEGIARARIFSETENVGIQMKQGRLRLRAANGDGWYEEQKEVAYNGGDVGFLIAARLVGEVLKHGKDCMICDGAIKVDVGKFIYISALEKPEGAAGTPQEVPPPQPAGAA